MIRILVVLVALCSTAHADPELRASIGIGGQVALGTHSVSDSVPLVFAGIGFDIPLAGCTRIGASVSASTAYETENIGYSHVAREIAPFELGLDVSQRVSPDLILRGHLGIPRCRWCLAFANDPRFLARLELELEHERVIGFVEARTIATDVGSDVRPFGTSGAIAAGIGFTSSTAHTPAATSGHYFAPLVADVLAIGFTIASLAHGDSDDVAITEAAFAYATAAPLAHVFEREPKTALASFLLRAAPTALASYYIATRYDDEVDHHETIIGLCVLADIAISIVDATLLSHH